MNLRKALHLLLLVLVAGLPVVGDTVPTASANTSAPVSVDLDHYRSELRRVDSKLRGTPVEQPVIREILLTTPNKYTVHNRGRDYEVDTAWLRNQLSLILAVSKSDREHRIDDLRQQVKLRLADADALAETTQKFDAEAQQKAKDILSRAEFHRVEQPHVWQTWLQRRLDSFVRWLDRLVSKASNIDWLGRIFIWGVIGLACSALAVYLFRLIRKSAPIEAAREPIPFTASRKPWRQWLREAQEASQRGDFREAVHCAYWAAISRLEEAGSWPADKTRTPREYLSFVKTSNPNHAGLLALTRSFEFIWYGNRDASMTHYEEARARVEGLSPR